MKRLCITAMLVTFAGPAFAGNCPSLWKQVDAKLKSATLSEADRAYVEDHRKRGEELHGTGHHGESEAALNAALAKLG